MKNLLHKMYKNRLKILTLMTFVFPVLPLILVSFWALLMMFADLFLYSQENINNRAIIWFVIAALWILGGISGLLSIIRSLFKIYNKKTLFLTLHGAFSYAIVAVAYIAVLIEGHTLVDLLFTAYLLMTLFVIAQWIVDLQQKTVNEKIKAGR